MATGEGRTFKPSEINSILFDVREGRASEDDARALLTLFCQCVEHGLISASNPVADRLLEHVRESLRAFLNGERPGQKSGMVTTAGQGLQDGTVTAAAGTDVPGIPAVKVSGIEAAFGLVKRKGRPEADEQTRIQMAAGVLRRYLAGMSHEDAVRDVGAEFGRAESVVSRAYRANRENAVSLLRLERPAGAQWTEDERAKLERVFTFRKSRI